MVGVKTLLKEMRDVPLKTDSYGNLIIRAIPAAHRENAGVSLCRQEAMPRSKCVDEEDRIIYSQYRSENGNLNESA